MLQRTNVNMALVSPFKEGEDATIYEANKMYDKRHGHGHALDNARTVDRYNWQCRWHHTPAMAMPVAMPLDGDHLLVDQLCDTSGARQRAHMPTLSRMAHPWSITCDGACL